MWPPSLNHLGELRKVNSALSLDERISEILAWEEEGGILLLGYTTFRECIGNKSRVSKDGSTGHSLSETQHREITRALLEKPNIVVADEAHEFKNLNSKISQAINKIECKSRIALTGSPLSNNLSEYFATIDWVAPGYLGSESNFRDVYERPIQQGLDIEATAGQYRASRKKLKALELDLEPKVHRADLSALHGNLHGKSEFVVKVPLTTFQDHLYRDVILGAQNASIGSKGLGNSTVWSYLSVLQLICNHPCLCLMEQKGSKSTAKDQGRVTEKQNLSEPSKIDEEPMMDDSVAEDILSTAIATAQGHFKDQGEITDSVHLSVKMQALMRIIELSGIAGDKVLIFSHRIATLDYIGKQLEKTKKAYYRIDGKVLTSKRQTITKSFNEGSVGVCLIATRAGGMCFDSSD